MLELQLGMLDMGYIDFYHFHGINKQAFDEKIIGFGLKKEVEKAIDEGLIKHISFSWHGENNDIPYVVESFEIFSSVLLQYNLLDRSNEKNIDYLANKGIGVVIMGPIGGGRLSVPSELSEKLLGKNFSTPELALRFVLGNKNVSCVMEMLSGNLKVADIETPMALEDFEKAIVMTDELKKLSDLYCTGCNYCMPCPHNVNIPGCFAAYNVSYSVGMYAGVQQYLTSTGINDARKNYVASNCKKCGKCEKLCPQHIQIIKSLKKTAKRMESFLVKFVVKHVIN
jgi:hypothetical protein